MNSLKLAHLMQGKGFEIVLYMQKDSLIYEKPNLTFKKIEIIKIKRKYFDFANAKKLANSLILNEIDKILIIDNKDLDLVLWTKKKYHKKLRVEGRKLPPFLPS